MQGGLAQLHRMKDGRVLVNDPVRRLLLVFDSTLSRVTTVMDALGGPDKNWTGIMPMVSFRGIRS